MLWHVCAAVTQNTDLPVVEAVTDGYVVMCVCDLAVGIVVCLVRPRVKDTACVAWKRPGFVGQEKQK